MMSTPITPHKAAPVKEVPGAPKKRIRKPRLPRTDSQKERARIKRVETAAKNKAVNKATPSVKEVPGAPKRIRKPRLPRTNSQKERARIKRVETAAKNKAVNKATPSVKEVPGAPKRIRKPRLPRTNSQKERARITRVETAAKNNKKAKRRVYKTKWQADNRRLGKEKQGVVKLQPGDTKELIQLRIMELQMKSEDREWQALDQDHESNMKDKENLTLHEKNLEDHGKNLEGSGTMIAESIAQSKDIAARRQQLIAKQKQREEKENNPTVVAPDIINQPNPTPDADLINMAGAAPAPAASLPTVVPSVPFSPAPGLASGGNVFSSAAPSNPGLAPPGGNLFGAAAPLTPGLAPPGGNIFSAATPSTPGLGVTNMAGVTATASPASACFSPNILSGNKPPPRSVKVKTADDRIQATLVSNGARAPPSKTNPKAPPSRQNAGRDRKANKNRGFSKNG